MPLLYADEPGPHYFHFRHIETRRHAVVLRCHYGHLMNSHMMTLLRRRHTYSHKSHCHESRHIRHTIIAATLSIGLRQAATPPLTPSAICYAYATCC